VRGNQQGFTFVELMVVMAMIALLLSVALPRYFDGLTRAQEAVLKDDLFTMREAIDQYYLDKGHYPSSLNSLVQSRYIKAVPVDPMTDSAQTWIELGLPNDPSVLFDIRSGASGEADDGTAYYDW
jgi:general secretion pathway protein G